MNTRAGKRRFIRSICRSIERQVIAAVPKMPREWDGHELREMLSNLFNHERTSTMRKDRKRIRSYRSECYARNIP